MYSFLCSVVYKGSRFIWLNSSFETHDSLYGTQLLEPYLPRITHQFLYVVAWHSSGVSCLSGEDVTKCSYFYHQAYSVRKYVMPDVSSWFIADPTVTHNAFCVAT